MAVAVAVGVSCAGRTAFIAPSGPGAAAPEAAAIWKSVGATCRAVTSYRAEFALTGRIGDRRIRGLASARLFTALSAKGDIGLEATVSGQLLFRLGGSSEEAVLLLRDENRIAKARPDQILDALIGVSLTPERLLGVVTGCITTIETFERAARHDQVLEIVTSDAHVFLTSVASAWQVRAGRFENVTVEYFAFERGLPRELRLTTSETGGQPVVLDLRVQALQTNIEIDPALFRVTMPEGARPITIDELRQVGPLAEDEASR